MFTFNDVQEAASSFKPTLNPGIHEVLILGQELITPDDPSKSKYVLVKFANAEATREVSIKFYINDILGDGKTKTALDISLSNLKHIANNCDLTDAEKARIKGNDKYELLKSMISACIGKEYRQKFTGEEYLDKNGQVQVKVGIGFPNFAESIKVPRTESKLLFKENDNYDYKRLPVQPKTEVNLPEFFSEKPTVEKKTDDDLPF